MRNLLKKKEFLLACVGVAVLIGLLAFMLTRGSSVAPRATEPKPPHPSISSGVSTTPTSEPAKDEPEVIKPEFDTKIDKVDALMDALGVGEIRELDNELSSFLIEARFSPESSQLELVQDLKDYKDEDGRAYKSAIFRVVGSNTFINADNYSGSWRATRLIEEIEGVNDPKSVQAALKRDAANSDEPDYLIVGASRDLAPYTGKEAAEKLSEQFYAWKGIPETINEGDYDLVDVSSVQTADGFIGVSILSIENQENTYIVGLFDSDAGMWSFEEVDA